MKKFITIAAVIAAIVAIPAQATMFRTVATQLYISNYLFCSAGFEGSNLENTAKLVEENRYTVGPEGDAVDPAFHKFFDREDHNAYWAGKDFKKQGLDKEICKDYTKERLRAVAESTGNADFIDSNPEMFKLSGE
ncbi:hypothetical protein D8V62_23865 [Salmonella enterica]|nr:hypothetical protein [Salmonella enterica]